MASDTFGRWARRFRCDAVVDSAALLRRHLQRVGLPDEPTKLVEGTVNVAAVAAAYSSHEGQSLKEFLALQAYNPALDPDVYYAFTFNLRDHAYARLITPLQKTVFDLADLYGHPWRDYLMCGYSEIRVSRLDDAPLTDAECDRIEATITDDIFFDFTDDEVWVVPDRTAVRGVLVVYLLDTETDMED